jgi:protein SCO1/2
MTPGTSTRTCGAVAVLALALAWPALAGGDHAGHGKAMAGMEGGAAHEGDHARHLEALAEQPTTAEAAQVKLLDLPVIDVEGRAHEFRSDVIKDRIVAINFVYTSCTTICPILSGLFTEVQDRLDGQLGPDVGLVSLSVDPATDVPPRLKRYAQQLEAGPGWTFLTGKKAEMAQVLAGLGAYTLEFEEHAPMILVGDARRDVWRRLYGFPSAEDIVDEVERLVAWRQAHESS